MEVLRPASDSGDSRNAGAFQLPPEMVDRAAARLCWLSTTCAVVSGIMFALQRLLQPEMRAMLDLPLIRLNMVFLILLSAGFTALIRYGWVSKAMLLDLGLVFQVVVSFCLAQFETALPHDRDAPVQGMSSVAVWLVISGMLLPNSPVKVMLGVIGSFLAWPASYWINQQVYHLQPLAWNRLAIWLFPIAVVAVWTYVLNKRVYEIQVREYKAEKLGSYQIDQPIGRGGMGEVWRAHHRLLARDAAIKVIRPEVLTASSSRQSELIRKRFEREARATASLRSPHTVALYDFGETKDHAFYYVMELLDGVDLQTLVERYGPLNPGRVVHILTEVCDSLEEGHRHSLVHRDIKPKNILLCRLGLHYDFTKVLDFGLVKSLSPSESTMMTMEGAATGTPAYLSPEIATGQEQIDGRADIYSLGCVAYFLLTGELVFNESSPMALALAHVQKQPVRPSERTELPIPSGLEAIVMQMLEKEPAKRPRSAQEVGRLLSALTDVRPWTPEDAINWWQTNLPETAVSIQTPTETSSEFAAVSIASRS